MWPLSRCFLFMVIRFEPYKLFKCSNYWSDIFLSDSEYTIVWIRTWKKQKEISKKDNTGHKSEIFQHLVTSPKCYHTNFVCSCFMYKFHYVKDRPPDCEGIWRDAAEPHAFLRLALYEGMRSGTCFDPITSRISNTDPDSIEGWEIAQSCHSA